MNTADEKFEKMVRHLQGQAYLDALAAYGEKGVERWRNPRFNGPLADADCSATLTGGCGDTIGIFLKFTNGVVSEAAYTTDGCASSALCGSFAAELAHGRTVEQLFDLEPADVLAAIGTFPEADRHCATLAISALQEAANRRMIMVSGSEKTQPPG